MLFRICKLLFLATCLLAVLYHPVHAALGQNCALGWTRFPTLASIVSGGQINRLVVVDPGGAGTRSTLLAGVATSSTIGGSAVTGVALWDGKFWRGTGPDQTPLVGVITALGTWDSDGAGPNPRRLVIASGGGRQISMWSGAAWGHLGSPLSQSSRAITTWDPDGDGPLGEMLISGGFSDSNFSVASWNGTSWQLVGTDFGAGNVQALTTWDEDGDGPLPPVLAAVVSVSFMTEIRTYNGQTWSVRGSTSGQVTGLVSWAGHGPPGSPPVLVVGGDFLSVNGVPVPNVALFDGTQWQAVGDGLPSNVTCLLAGTNASSTPFLYAGSALPTAPSRVYELRNDHWVNVATNGMTRPAVALALFDPDGAGPEPERLICSTANSGSYGQLYRLVGSNWQTLQAPLQGNVFDVEIWDPDGPGGAPPHVVACGNFPSIGGDLITIPGVPANQVALWDETQWRNIGPTDLQPSSPQTAYQIRTYDPDGEGPQPPNLYVGTTRAATSALYRWDGSRWQWCGRSGYDITSLYVWDRDGAGPAAPLLVCGGSFSATTADGSFTSNLAAWDGSFWQSLGGRVNGPVYAVGEWDPDGPGPTQSRLVIAGAFTLAGDVPAPGLAMFDGISWTGLAGPVAGTQATPGGQSTFVNTICQWDPDGDGPLNPVLVIGGDFTSVGGVPAANVATWNGAQWRQVGGGVSNAGGYVSNYGTAPYVFSAVSWDPDGSGPLPPELVIGGNFLNVWAGSVTTVVNRLARWNGSRWLGFSSLPADPFANGGFNGAVFSLRAQSQPNGPDRLICGGFFTACDNLGSGRIAILECPGNNCLPDVDSSGTLTINDVLVFLSRWFTGDRTADFNGFGGVTSQDIFDFLAAWFQGC